MSFDYEKVKSKSDGSGGEHWTSNSDLFMVLSVVFLLLYVVASVRNGASAINKAIKVQELKNEKEDLARQLRAYNTLKKDYLQKEAQEEEVSMYEDLMKNLELLQSEAERKRRALESKARKNAQTKEALNQYQQMVRNIINTNLLAKKRINKRDEVIVKKKEEIAQQKDVIEDLDMTVKNQAMDIKKKARAIVSAQKKIEDQNVEISERQKNLVRQREEIDSLEVNLKSKQKIVDEKELEINSLNSNLDAKIADLKKEAKNKRRTQQQMRAEVLKLRLNNRKKVSQLKLEKKDVERKLEGLSSEIDMANEKIISANEALQAKEIEQENLQKEYEETASNYKNQLKDMSKEFENKIKSQRMALDNQLKKEKASAKEKSKRLAQFKKQASAEREHLEEALGKLEEKVYQAEDALSKMEEKTSDYEKKLAKAKSDHGRYLSSLKDLKSKNKDLSGDLSKYKEIVDAKKKLAKDLERKLLAKGIDAKVNGKNGEVAINFGDEYFDSGSANLKRDMKNVLKKFVPEYSRTLFSDPKVAEKIKNVEVIGFSSPTYKGKYVDPNSLKKEDRAALNYNLDLSFQRAKSIFSYMTDTSKMKFEHQKTITPMLKVTGRSYLADGVKGRDLASGISRKEYCSKYDCDKSQKVIIRFNLKD